MKEKRRLGVGFLGAGPVTQAIHLPTLARMTDTFTVVHVNDVDAVVASSVAGRVGARHSTTIETLLDDPAVDVVAICSPHRFHAEQAIAACRAGKKAVLCEKPFAMTSAEASEISEIAAETGVPILVGAMHTFDPAWRAVTRSWSDLPDTCHTVRSSIVLPPNPRFEDFATEVLKRPAATEIDLSDPDAQADLIHDGVMTLAIHNLPLVRRMLPHFEDLQILSATALAPPYGYDIVATAAGRRLELHSTMSDTWQPRWIFEAYTREQVLHTEFTPSFVQAGSAVSTLHTSSSARVFGPADYNGYEGEWREIADIVAGSATPPDLHGLIEDLRFAIALADAASAFLRRTHKEHA